MGVWMDGTWEDEEFNLTWEDKEFNLLVVEYYRDTWTEDGWDWLAGS